MGFIHTNPRADHKKAYSKDSLSVDPFKHIVYRIM